MSPSAVSPEVDFTTFHNIIDGSPRDAKESFHGIDPTTGEDLWSVPVATKQDVDDAVRAAQKAFGKWKTVSFEERKEYLKRFKEVWSRYHEEMTALLAKETGKPKFLAANEVSDSMTKVLDWYLAMEEVQDRSEDDEKIVITRYSPLGVVGAICPWNFPVVLALWKVIPAVLAGNAVIVKPSPFTPYTGLKAVEIAQQVFPPGLVQAVGGGEQVGPMLTTHPDIAKISFTGSIATGKKVMEACAKTLKRVTLELGGNDAAIVMPDVDIQSTAPQVAMGAFLNSGQICVATKRIFIHEDIYQPFLEAMVNFTKTLKVGASNEDGVMLGPIQNSMQYEKVKGIFADSKDKGYKFAVGQEEVSGGKGYFIQPTIIDNPPDGSRIIQEEPFGPIVPCQPWSDEADVIKRANSVNVGLGSSVWAKDVEKAQQIGWQLAAGSVFINSFTKPTPQAAFGGHKESGIGTEGGKNALASYSNAHVMQIYK